MSGQEAVRSVQSSEADRFAATMTLAFAADPIVRWAMADANDYINVFLPLVGAFGGSKAIEQGTAHVVGDFHGVATWLPPGTHTDDEAMGEIFARHIDEEHLASVGALFEAMAAYHPKEPHWYLPLIGIDPAQRGRGLGSDLMRHALALCDEDRCIGYLEATSPRNVPFYKRHGFEIIGEIVVGNSPPMFPMLRKVG